MIYGMEKYIKYFDEIIGNKRFVNGYIFHGVEGVGKKKFAKEVARVALCQRGSTFNEECECNSCNLVKNGTHPDLTEVLPYKDRKTIGIDNIREIGETIYFSSFMGGYRFFIIDNFHELSVEGCNAFLKTLEEPSDNVVFFLITNQFQKILPTIKSRTIHLRFKRLSIDHIKMILKDLGYEDEKEIGLAAEFSGGSVSVALQHIRNIRDGKIQIKDLIINEGDFGDFIIHCNNLLKLLEKDEIRYYIVFLLKRSLEIFRKTGEYKYLVFINKLLECQRMLDYNVNIRILRGYILTNIYGVLSEKI